MPKIYGDLEFQGTTRVVADVNGTALLPSITFSGNLTTGMYRHAINVLGFTTNGVLRLLINSEGALVISDITAPITTTNKLYSVSGNLFWNGGQIVTGSGFLSNIIEDTTPQLGGTLDVLTNAIITSTVNGNIAITPNGAGNVVLAGLTYPNADGAPNQALVTNGFGVLSFATISGLNNVVEDLTPQLGGNLDVQTSAINTSVVNGNISITPNGVGNIVLDGLSWPNADGTGNQVLSTNGLGALSWINQISVSTAISFTTYTATAGQTSFLGADDNAAVLNYTVGFLDVYMNGVLLDGSQYAAITGTSVVLTAAAVAGDTLQTTAYNTSTVANAYTKAESDSLFANKALSNTFTVSPQILSAALPELRFKETDTVNQDYTINVSGGSFLVQQITDADILVGTVINIAPASKTLAFTSTDITYNGTSLLSPTIPAASETVSGIAELATQVETDAGTDDLRIVTPLKLANYSGLGVSGSTAVQLTEYTAAAGQTVFGGADNHGTTLAYTPGNLYVYKNGVLLHDTVDYVATTGTGIVLNVAAALNDLVQATAFSAILGVGASATDYLYTATASQTTFTGNDDNGSPLSYNPGDIMVFLNGTLLKDVTDYTATDSTSVVLAVGATAGNILQIFEWGNFLLSSNNQTLDQFVYTATAGQTIFSGNDDNTKLLAYTAGSIKVYSNGTLLEDTTDYTASNGTSIVLVSAATLNDVIQITSFGTFSVSNHYTKIESDGKYAITASANTFTQEQIISGTVPILRLKDTATVDKDYRIAVSSGLFYLQQMSDAGVALSNAVVIEPSAKTLQLSPAAVTFDANKIHHDGDEEAWIAPAFLNGWVNIGGVWAATAYRKAADGRIDIRGYVKTGTLTSAVFTLPVGYRPTAQIVVPTVVNPPGSVGELKIFTSGDVVVDSGSSILFQSVTVSFYP